MASRLSLLWAGSFALLLSNSVMAADAERYNLVFETQTIPDIENRPITFHVHRPETVESLPILLVIDGSGCGGQLRPGWLSLYQPTIQLPPFARLAIEKPGVEPTDNRQGNCSSEYRERQSLDNRLVDHLRVLQHLGHRAEWWDGRLLIFGWSDGGDLGARLSSYYPNVSRAVFGGMGGGYTMAEHIIEFWDCARDRTDNRDACISEIERWFSEVRSYPVASRGNKVTNLQWRSKLFVDLATILEDSRFPVLIVHGANDREQAPVESARLLVTRLRDAGRVDLEYCEVESMGHGTDSLELAQAKLLEDAMFDFLFDPEHWKSLQATNCNREPNLEDVRPPDAL